ncbi:MAG: tyrosine-type recombinase/integrase, partial [Anaeroplasmataceae bacterium]|nr:tyrosine-type recombinase/integrase [Anaeroplasmataceae bacterium]
CIVIGKGNKQRRVYFDAKTKIELKQYLASRNDNNEALFVSRFKPHNRLEISGVEIAVRKVGKRAGIGKVHPHKFRRTIATKAIDKGMPIEQVQKMLGHAKIDTTLEYAMVDENNVKNSHKKYLE